MDEEVPKFVLYANDPAAPLALHAYASAASMYGKSYEYCQAIHNMAADFVRWRKEQEE